MSFHSDLSVNPADPCFGRLLAVTGSLFLRIYVHPPKPGNGGLRA